MLYRLIILNGRQKGERQSVGVGPLVIGSGPDCSFRLDAPDVACEHAQVESTEQGLYIRDLGTVNRILVNRREVSESLLKHGDTLEIGPVDLLVQACLEADISGGARPVLSRGSRARIRLLLAIAAVLTWMIWRRSDGGLQTEPVPPPVVQPMPAAPVAVPEPQPVVALPEPSPVPDPAVAASEAVSEELRQLRQALADLQKTVHDKMPQEASPPLPSAAPTLPAAEARPVMDSDEAHAVRELAAARVAIEAGRWEEAHARLDVILANHAEDRDALELKAAAYERQGQLEKAVGLWSRILVQSGGGDRLHAEGERNRLTQEVLRMRKPEPRLARLGKISIHKFPDSAEYDEMRLLNVEVERMTASWPGETSLQVAFFDRSPDGRILLSQALGSKDKLPVLGDPDAEILRSETTYLVPRSGRKRSSAGPEQDRYYGYLVRLMIGGRVEDEIARPESLLKPPEPSSGAPPATGGS